MPPTGPSPGPRARRRRTLALAAVGCGLALGVVLVVFQPWKLVVDDVVDEALPTVSSAPAQVPRSSRPAGSPTAETGATSPAAPSPTSEPGTRPVVLARGTLISHEHATSGRVVLLRLPDGSRVVRLEELDTSNGPDLKVWLTDRRVVDGPSGWTVFDDGRYLDLGSLKGNKGNQNYAVPADAELAGLTSVSIWCDRFNVSFGAATLEPV